MEFEIGVSLPRTDRSRPVPTANENQTIISYLKMINLECILEIKKMVQSCLISAKKNIFLNDILLYSLEYQ